ncbi:MAG: hypothetical protein HY791_25770 [Deltaproteobacteria bacterium]|nr:hypothetical protein [Deltaproteobacteria bacterium]
MLKAWTREDRVYDRLESRLFATATFHSPAFRKAFMLRHEDFSGPGSEQARSLSLTSAGAEESLEFFVSTWTPNPDWNDFDQDDSIWRVTLVTDAGSSAPSKITKVKANANIRAIYPYITDHSLTYSVRFPLTDGASNALISSSTKQFRLELISSVAKATLTWDLAPLGKD